MRNILHFSLILTFLGAEKWKIGCFGVKFIEIRAQKSPAHEVWASRWFRMRRILEQGKERWIGL